MPLELAVDLYAKLGDRIQQAHARANLGNVLERQGKPAESLHHAELALELFRAAGDPTGHAYALNVVGWGHAVLGDHRRAITYCQQALALQQRLGDRYHEAETLTRIGDTHHAGNEDAAVHEAWRLALTIIEELGHPDADLVRSKLRSARQPRFPVTKSG
jgi:tetratricopeptide (TPR) repeat protein